MVAVQERNRLLHVHGRARGEGGIHQILRALRTDARVLLPCTRIGGARERWDMGREIAHGVVPRHRGAQRGGIEQVHLDRRCAQGACEFGLGRRADDRGHGVAVVDQRSHRAPAEHTGGTGNEDSHPNLPGFGRRR